MSSILNIFTDGDNFKTIAEAEQVADDLLEDVLEVQYPDSKRGLNKSRNDVNNRLKKYVARCKLCQLKASTADKDNWKALGQSAVKMQAEMRKTKDSLSMLDGIW